MRNVVLALALVLGLAQPAMAGSKLYLHPLAADPTFPINLAANGERVVIQFAGYGNHFPNPDLEIWTPETGAAQLLSNPCPVQPHRMPDIAGSAEVGIIDSCGKSGFWPSGTPPQLTQDDQTSFRMASGTNLARIRLCRVQRSTTPQPSVISRVTYSLDDKTHVWTETDEALATNLPAGLQPIQCVAMDSTGDTMVASFSGYHQSRFAVWSDIRGWRLIDLPTGFDLVYPQAASANAEWVVGLATINNVPSTFVWSAKTGYRVLAAAPWRVDTARAVSRDGCLVISTATVNGGPTAVFWSPRTGWQELSTLVSNPAELQGYHLFSAVWLSTDGRTIAGNALKGDFHTGRAFALRLDAPLGC